jgi:ABC-type antimicrobial peptide transport system permease subunit
MSFWSRLSTSKTDSNTSPSPEGLAKAQQPKASYWVRTKGFATRLVTFFRFSFIRISMFILLILTYVIAKITFHIWYWRTLWKERHTQTTGGVVTSGTPSEILFSRYSERLFRLFHTANGESIDKVGLIEIAIRNMKGKKTRTAVTIGGMAIGIGSIVFLVSIGYGLQRLVISQVAELQEMQQADVSLQPGGKIKMSDETVNTLTQIPNVASVDPLISVVGKVNYQNSVSDMAVYGVTTHYLDQSATRPVRGKFYDSLDIIPSESSVGQIQESEIPKHSGDVAEEIAISSTGLHWVRARSEANTTAEELGFVRIDTTEQVGQFVWGEAYTAESYGKAGVDSQGQSLGKWIKVTASLFEEVTCDISDADCVGGEYKLKRDEGGFVVERQVFFAVTDSWLSIRVLSNDEKQKLLQEAGATAALNVVQSGDGWVEIAGEGGSVVEENIERVAIAQSAKREAVVSRAMLRVLGINEDESIGKTFNVSFVITGSLLEDSQKKVESIPVDYTIVGLIPEDKSPIFYVPFIDLRGLGIRYYSQAKVTALNQEVLADVRKQIEGLGYVTTSVADTVSQINAFFASARIILGLLGMVALGVAALGMFNTLTVSLLERTREVGLMKAIGMKSVEVQELFLTESMVMAFFGGILGLLFGFLAGKALGAGLSLLAIFKGAGAIDVSYIPAPFVIAILVFSLIVGIITGIYPARRATNISALNALRYE